MISKTVATESKESHESREMSEERGAGDEGKDNGEGSIEPSNPTTSTTVSTVPVTTSQFLFTDDFKRLFVGFIMGDTLMTLRLATKAWKAVAEAFIDEGVRSSEIIVHGGRDFFYEEAEAHKERRKLITRAIFLLNITKAGERACKWAENLVVVDIPEGFESIRWAAFANCRSLTTVSFPTTLTSIGESAFYRCYSLENVDLLHTNLQEIGDDTFMSCSELKSMTIPDSLQTLGDDVFWNCSKLVPSSVSADDNNAVVAHLRSLQN